MVRATALHQAGNWLAFIIDSPGMSRMVRNYGGSVQKRSATIINDDSDDPRIATIPRVPSESTGFFFSFLFLQVFFC
jgi:hypothetical protein